jgi:hypothetical protein
VLVPKTLEKHQFKANSPILQKKKPSKIKKLDQRPKGTPEAKPCFHLFLKKYFYQSSSNSSSTGC